MIAGWCPKATHFGNDAIALNRVLVIGDTLLLAGLGNGVLHHEALHRQRPPTIKNGELPAACMVVKVALGQHQALHNTLPQRKGALTRAIGHFQYLRCVSIG